MLSLLVAGLIMLIVVCVIAAVVCWILQNIPGVPAFAPRIVWAIAGIIVLIWLLKNVLPVLGVH